MFLALWIDGQEKIDQSDATAICFLTGSLNYTGDETIVAVCTLETYIILVINVTPIHFMKNIKERKTYSGLAFGCGVW